MKHKQLNVKTNNFKVNVEFYDSANELVEVCKKRSKLRGDDDSFSRTDLKKSWYGVTSSKEAMNLLATGWSDNVNSIARSMSKITANGYTKRTTFHNDVVGFSPIVPLALLGVPTSMMNSKIKPMKAKIIDIVYDITVSAANDSDVIFENGKKICEVIIGLEKQGYRVRLSAIQGYTGDSSGDFLVVKIKDEAQPLDLKRIAFPLTHPAMFRIIGFGWYERVPSGTWRPAYGRALANSMDEKKLQQFSREAFNKTSIYVSGTIMKGKTIEQVQEMLIQNSKEVVA